MSLYYTILLVVVFCNFVHINDAQGFFGRPSIFGLGNAAQMVRFANTACRGENQESGTCLTGNECDRRSGQNTGACANGAGVCCAFKVSFDVDCFFVIIMYYYHLY